MVGNFCDRPSFYNERPQTEYNDDGDGYDRMLRFLKTVEEEPTCGRH